MNSNIITISDNGVLTIPSAQIRMRDFEIADLLGVTIPAVRGKIKTLLKSRMGVDCCGGLVSVSRKTITPEYFGLEVVIAVAFQVDSYNAVQFRKHVLSLLTKPSRETSPNIYLRLSELILNQSLPN